jgi:hypothetical protein
MSHEVHAPPPVPQELIVPGLRQLVPEQQPGHEVESHTQAPVTQRSPAPQVASVPHLQTWFTQLSPPTVEQVAQRAPPLPHALGTVPATQVLPWQHPLGQLAALHTQEPFTQEVPTPHDAPVPHWHWPFAPQVSFATRSQLAHARPP